MLSSGTASGPASSIVPFDRSAHGDAGQRGGDVVGRDRLDQGRGQAHGAVRRARAGDGAEELEELGGPQDRVRHVRRLDQILLGDLGAQVAAVGQPVRADHRERDVVTHAGGLLRGQQVAPGGLEEVEHRGVVEGRRVGHVHHDVGAGEHLGQTLAGEGVDAGAGRRRDGLVTRAASRCTSFEPISPVPPMTTIFMVVPFISQLGYLLSGDLTRTCPVRVK